MRMLLDSAIPPVPAGAMRRRVRELVQPGHAAEVVYGHYPAGGVVCFVVVGDVGGAC